MTPDLLFKVTCLIAASGWIVLLFASPFWKGFDKFVLGVVVALLAFTYSYLNFTNFDPDILTKFSTLDGVASLFQNKSLLLAAWVHIMAFDLAGAVWMKKNAEKIGIKHLFLVPALILTCGLGPLGFLVYMLTRWLKTKTYFANNVM